MAARGGSYTPKRGPDAGRTFASYRQYLATKERRSQPARSAAAYGRLSPRQREAQQRAASAISRARREGISLSEAARKEGTSLHNVRQYTGHAVTRAESGRYLSIDAARIPRALTFNAVGYDEPVTVVVTDSKTASMIGGYHNAVRQYLHTGDDSRLRRFRGKGVWYEKRFYAFQTDPRELDRLARFGLLPTETIYERAA